MDTRQIFIQQIYYPLVDIPGHEPRSI